MQYLLIVAAVLLALLLYEYRFRKPDQIVVYEKRDGLGIRRMRLYPRHFSLALSRTTHSFVQTIDASARGNLDIRVKLAVTVAASFENLGVLVRVGGWSADAVSKAAKELEVMLLGHVKEYTERKEIEELSSESIRQYLLQRLSECRTALGLEIIALTIASFEPVNPQIAEAMRQQEHARILDQAETVSQQARIAAARARLKADEEIAIMENELELKKSDLKRAQLEKEWELNAGRADQELRLKQMQLEFEEKELRMLKESPELLLLTPQAARLAEASQSLKNARTVVSLSPSEVAQGSELMGVFQSFLKNALDAWRKRTDQ
ncbi:MAG: hypothetical protein HXY20_08130 [Acidobacteria bacterium]|nr:hypothetical protein [Acidobacteriota bacterium]